jgi:hypothetical protein
MLNKEISNVVIQKFILKNYKKMDTYEMANVLGVMPHKVAGNKAALKRGNKIGDDGKPNTSKLLKKPKIEKNTYKNHNGFNKGIAREKMANIIVKSGVNGIIPCLPNKDWTIEQMINTKVNANTFLGVEREVETFKVMRTNLKRLKKTGNFFGSAHLGNIADIIFGRYEASYAHMILDYCGNLKTIQKELEYAIQHNILALNGYMAVTFAKPIRGIDAESQKLLDLAPDNNTDSRCASDKATEAYFHKITGFTHKVVEFFYYQDTYPMTLVLIKRIK